MRRPITLALLLATGVVAARDLFVVVHTREAQVIVFRCDNPDDRLGEAPLQRVMMTHPGSVEWHVVGGVAPYTVLSEERDRMGNVCFTVMDAAGTIAKGCGIVDVNVDVRYVNCPSTAPQEVVVPLPVRSFDGAIAPVARMERRPSPPAPPVDRHVRAVDPVSRGSSGTTPTVTHYGTRSRGEGGGGPMVTPGLAPTKR